MDNETTVHIARFRADGLTNVEDIVAVEEPLEIFIDDEPFYMTMRSPGLERELALGLCFADGHIDSLDDVALLMYCDDDTGNRVDIRLNQQRKAVNGVSANGKASSIYSSCGICGKDMIDEIRRKIPVRSTGFATPSQRIEEIIDTLDECQEVFSRTGGTHAAAVFDKDWGMLAFAEDVGRHNALDKAIGKTVLMDRLQDIAAIGLTSRLSYEMVLKTGRTPAQILVGISAPTSLGIDLAREINLTVVGFAKKGRFNIYSAPERIST